MSCPHTLRALKRYDRMQPVLGRMFERGCGGVSAFVAWETAARRELMLVQLAYRRDTYKINSLDNCLRVDVEFMRRIANLPAQPTKP